MEAKTSKKVPTIDRDDSYVTMNPVTSTTRENRTSTSDTPHPPDEFLCPLTLEVMNVPLMTRWGHSFERNVLLKWIDTHHNCPLTRNPISLSDVVVNRPLQARIQYWKHQTSISPHYERDDDSNERIFLATLDSESQAMDILRRSMMLRATAECDDNRNSKREKDDTQSASTGSRIVANSRGQQTIRRARAA